MESEKKPLKRIKLNQLSKEELTQRGMNFLKGGACSDSCKGKLITNVDLVMVSLIEAGY